jgi:uncharacterized protein YciI
LDFFIYSRDADGVEALRDDDELLERHWSYMDAFADSMVARGPTFAADGETVTGSLHIVGLPSPGAAREFVAREPNNRAGVYGEHVVWRFENLLGRTMWEFAGTAEESIKVLAIARTGCEPTALSRLPISFRERLIVYGALSAPESSEPIGVALALEAESPETAADLLEDAGIADAEIHAWEFGGRR